jgi:hypothetical protein
MESGSLHTGRTVVAVNVKKIVGLLALALLIFFVITQPSDAAGSLQNIATTLRGWAESMTTFFTELV